MIDGTGRGALRQGPGPSFVYYRQCDHDPTKAGIYVLVCTHFLKYSEALGTRVWSVWESFLKLESSFYSQCASTQPTQQMNVEPTQPLAFRQIKQEASMRLY